MANTSRDYETVWSHHMQALVRPPRQKVLNVHWCSDQGKSHHIPWGQISLQRMRNQRARGFPESILYFRDEDSRD